MIYLLLAEGFEETEMIAPLDVLRRAGIPVKTVGVTGAEVLGAHGVCVKADLLPDDVKKEDADGVILPGGMPGTTNLEKSEFVLDLLDYCAKEKKLVGAICAAPMILGKQGYLKGRAAVCFPGFEEYLHGATIEETLVATDENFITAKGAGAALEFGAALTNYLKGEGVGEGILAAMQTPGY